MESLKNNTFVKLTKARAGRVGVRLQENQFNKDDPTKRYFGRAERYTLDTQNILDGIENEIPHIDMGTATAVLNAYGNVVLTALQSGNSIKFGELGVIYIASKGTVEKDGDKPELTVRFTPTQALKDAVKDVEITSSELKSAVGKITTITDVQTGSTDGTLSAGGSCLIEGTGIKIGGEDSGIWFAPVAENGAASTDENMWIQVESTLIRNTASKLLFGLPPYLVAGKSYRIVLRSHYAGTNGHERKELVETVSEMVKISGTTSQQG